MISDSQLNEVMEIDHVVHVHADGRVTDNDIPGTRELWVPRVIDEEVEPGEEDNWSLFSAGYTGQYGYRGPIMHDSEFIGGQLARDILAQPGYYVAVAAYYSPEDDENEEGTWEGWAVLYQPCTDCEGPGTN